jgi:hypothetical protein
MSALFVATTVVMASLVVGPGRPQQATVKTDAKYQCQIDG